MEAWNTVPSGSLRRLGRLRSSARYGRLRARLPRFGFIAVTAVLCLAGVRSIVLPSHASPPPESVEPLVDYAEQSFATAFARAYLAYDSSHPGYREAALGLFISSSLDLGAGFTPPSSGSQRVTWTDIAQVQRPLTGGVIVTVVAKLSTQPEPVYLSVPVRRAAGGAIYLDGYPAFVGPPLTTRSGLAEADREAVEDGEISTLVERSLTNYLGGDAANLAADLAEAATVTLPPNQLALHSVDQLEWVDGSGSGAVLATVSASDTHGGRYTLRYEVGLRRVEGSDPRIAPGWRVTFIQTISQET